MFAPDPHDVDGYDLDDPCHPTWADRITDSADNHRKFAGTDLAEHDELHDLGPNHAAIEAERPAVRELKAWDL